MHALRGLASKAQHGREYRKMSKDDAILVIGPSWIGDMIMAQCLFATLKTQAPDRIIDVVAPAWARPVLARMPQVRRAIATPFGHQQFALAARVRLGRSLRGRYANAFVLPGSWKSAVVPWAAAVPARSGYLREARWGLLNDIRPLPPDLKRKTATAYQALADPGVLKDPSRLAEPHLTIDAGNRSRLLAQWNLPSDGFVAAMPGAEFGPAKRWPARHWAALADALAARGLTTVLLGSSGDAPVAVTIAEGRPHVVDLTGQTRLEDAIDLLSASRCAVSNDSGLMHAAAAVGTPVVALYGSTSPLHTPPLSVRSQTVSLQLDCAPCGARTCPLGHLRCLEDLLPQQVLARLDGLSPHA
jgi:heptosyltransferase II